MVNWGLVSALLPAFACVGKVSACGDGGGAPRVPGAASVVSATIVTMECKWSTVDKSQACSQRPEIGVAGKASPGCHKAQPAQMGTCLPALQFYASVFEVGCGVMAFS